MQIIEKSRIESFSDGVFTIVITLLILPVYEYLPDLSEGKLANGLSLMISNLIAYVMSFLIIGIYWLNHHQLFLIIKHVNVKLIWYNMFHLLFVSLISLCTALSGKYPYSPWSAFAYGLILLMSNLFSYLILVEVQRDDSLVSDQIDKRVFRTFNFFYPLIAIAYVLAMMISFVSPILSYSIYFGVNVSLVISSYKGNLMKKHFTE